EIAGDVVDMTQPEWDQVAAGLDSPLRTLYAQGIKPEQLDAVKAEAVKSLPATWTDRQKRVGTELLRQNLDANVTVDQLATNLAQSDARNAVTPVQVQVAAGEIVVRDGDVVSRLQVEKLRALGLANEGTDWRGAVGLLLWAGLIAFVLALFIERYATEAWLDDRKMVLVILSLLAITAAGRTLVPAQLIIAALVSGFGSGLLAFAGMAILGHIFRIPTVFELRELADPNHPLLRQLLLRTPGTYHHSLLVANLAERAAEVIGADPLLARVGAYYHDIGKMRNPSAFIENQTGTNPHDDLDPLVSAGIVAAHLKDGLALAERY